MDDYKHRVIMRLYQYGICRVQISETEVIVYKMDVHRNIHQHIETTTVKDGATAVSIIFDESGE